MGSFDVALGPNGRPPPVLANGGLPWGPGQLNTHNTLTLTRPFRARFAAPRSLVVLSRELLVNYVATRILIYLRFNNIYNYII